MGETVNFKDFPPIDKKHYELPYGEQLEAHKNAIDYLKTVDFKVTVINADNIEIPSIFEIDDEEDFEFDSSIFKWENTDSVSFDIQASSKIVKEVHIYGVASQFNGAEAMARYTIDPGFAYIRYQSDPTQGPRAQIQFPKDQVEALNISANMGFNGLINILDEDTKTSVRHGYFCPDSDECAKTIVKKLQTEGEKLDYIAAVGLPEEWEWKSNSKAEWNTKRPKNTELVHEVLVAAPAIGGYKIFSNMTDEDETEIQFLCAARAMQAQLSYLMEIRAQTPEDKLVVLKPTTPGLGVFGNEVKPVAKGFAFAMKQFEEKYNGIKGVEVRLQVYKGRGASKQVAEFLSLEEHKE